jgi:DNA primase large subunit
VADFLRLAHYPFLPGVREAVRQAQPSWEALTKSPGQQAARDRAVARIAGALGDGIQPARIRDERDGLDELLSVALARMICIALAERPLLSRYAAAEARLAHQRLLADADQLDDAQAALGLEAEATESGWRLHFSNYIRAAPLSEPEWKLLRRPVDKGFLTLGDPELARLCEEALERRILGELEAELAKPLPGETREALAPMLHELEPKLEEARERWSEGELGPVQPGLFPPCVRELFEQMKQGKNIPHHGRFAFTTFLHAAGWNTEQIMEYLSQTPNFDREKSRYQIEHITGSKGVEAYMVPNCSTMQTNGVCPLEKRDNVCFRIKNPLGYYRRRIWLQRRDGPPAAPIAPDVTTGNGPPGGAPAAPAGAAAHSTTQSVKP